MKRATIAAPSTTFAVTNGGGGCRHDELEPGTGTPTYDAVETRALVQGSGSVGLVQ